MTSENLHSADLSAKHVAVIGGGPAGLMAAEVMSSSGLSVSVYDGMPSVGRKFLLAGKSGLNLTHGEPHAQLLQRFGKASARLKPALDAFAAADICAWAGDLGIEVFTGSSGRIFPKAMKASPLLRAWLARLRKQGVTFNTRHRWNGLASGDLEFATPEGTRIVHADAVLLAMGGASWPRLGSDAAWVPLLQVKGIDIAPLQVANCGFDIGWSESFRERFAGVPVKSVTVTSEAGRQQGEFVISRHGVEGGLIYAHAAALRDRLEKHGSADLILDLVPGRQVERLAADFARQKSKDSFATRLRKGAGLDGVKSALLRECVPQASRMDAGQLAAAIKTLHVPLLRPRPIAEAISTAGGIALEALDGHYMLKALPGVFAAGEMLDWEAPTGGYLLTACMATARAAGAGIASWLAEGGQIGMGAQALR